MIYLSPEEPTPDGMGKDEYGYPDCVRSGSQVSDDGDSGYWWLVFSRKNPHVSEAINESADLDELCQALTGWESLDGGPGRICHLWPRVRVYKHAVLVSQMWVRDV